MKPDTQAEACREQKRGIPVRAPSTKTERLSTLARALLGPSPVARREHLLEALCLSVASDGELQDAELDAVLALSAVIPGRGAAREPRLVEYLTRCAAEVQVRGPAHERLRTLEDAMRREPLRAREEVLALATLIQYVDGELSNEEEDFLNELAQALGLTLEQAQAVVERVEQALAQDVPRST